MEENSLLTFEEVSFILYDATDPSYQIVNLFHPGFKKNRHNANFPKQAINFV